ncbi:MAG: glycosyltransferase family 4 protein [Pseudonocardiaceae bacterium]
MRATCTVLAQIGDLDLLIYRYAGAPAHDPPIGPYARVYTLADCNDIEHNRTALFASAPDWLRTTPYDIIWFCQERIWLAARGLASGRTILDVDDLHDIVLERWIAIGKNACGAPLGPAERRRMIAEIDWWRAIHGQAAAECDVVVFTSEHDRARFLFRNAVVVPNSYEPVSTAARPPHSRVGAVLLYQGYLEWSTNEDAAGWLAEHVVPWVLVAEPRARLLLVGKPSARVQELSRLPYVDIVGEVDNMAPYLDVASVVVAPLRVGGGTRIKIIEAFAHRIPVVTTKIGAEGLDVVDGTHLLLGETPDKQAAACVRILRSDDLVTTLTNHAFALFEDRYQPRHTAAGVVDAVRLAAGVPGQAFNG